MPKAGEKLKETSVRKLQADRNRQALIEATLDAIADVGIAQCSVSEIIRRAGLSRGMIHLHFGSKEALFVAAVQQFGAQYYDVVDEFLNAAGDTPQERLAAVVLGDLDERILNRRIINIWYAFRGEARERQVIARHCDTRDARLNNLIFRSFAEIARSENEQDASLLARDATHGTLAMLEGMWTDFLLHPDAFDRRAAKRIVFRLLSGLFPRHFDLNGAIRPEQRISRRA